MVCGTLLMQEDKIGIDPLDMKIVGGAALIIITNLFLYILAG